MAFRVLGPFEVVGDGEVERGGPQQRTFLALLVLRAEIVSTDALVEAIWGDRPPSSALPVVRTFACLLRRALTSAGARLLGTAPGYLLDVDPDAVDAGRFKRFGTPGSAGGTPKHLATPTG